MLQKNSKILVGYKMFLFTWKFFRMNIKLFIVYNMLTCLHNMSNLQLFYFSFLVCFICFIVFMPLNSIYCVGYQIFKINFAMLTFFLRRINSKSHVMNTSASLSSHIRQWTSEAAYMTIISEQYHRTCKKQIHTLTDRQTRDISWDERFVKVRGRPIVQSKCSWTLAHTRAATYKCSIMEWCDSERAYR